ncbi:hypothetical protein AB0L05_07165 [Nonomuraea pusilla]|uniref:hypothetical protein n=1 Tax=Nonomuraea pusilla TaxID=46177 RepID=UPI00331F3050
MLRRSLSVLLPMVTVLALQAAGSAPASAAAYGCTGSLVRSWPLPLKDEITKKTYYVSDIKLFYDRRTGWNCAVLAKRPGDSRYGERTPMSILLWNDTWPSEVVKNNVDADEGHFKYHAGPVKVYGRNHCVSILAKHGDYPGPDGPGGPKYNGRRLIEDVACR